MIDWSEPEPDAPLVEMRTMEEAMALIDRWIAAEGEAWRAYVRLHADYITMKARAESAETLAANFELLYQHRYKL